MLPEWLLSERPWLLLLSTLVCSVCVLWHFVQVFCQLWLADITESPLTSSAPTGGCRQVCNNLLKISGQQSFQSLCSEFLLHSWKQQKDSVMKLVDSPETWIIEKVDTILMKAATELGGFQFSSTLVINKIFSIILVASAN